jgi:hypothetical protein
MTLNKINNLKIDTGAKSSRFVVDLKKELSEEEAKEVKIQKSTTIEEKLERMAEADYGKILKRGREKSRVLMNDFGKALKNFWIPASPVKYEKHFTGQAAGMTINNTARNDNLLNQLAFVGLAKLLFSLFYKICYAVGWTIMFILRLVYFIFLAIAKPLAKSLNYLFIKFYFPASRLLKDLPVGFQATQAMAMSFSAKFLALMKHSESGLASPHQTAITEKLIIPPSPLYQGGLKSLLKPVLIFAGVLLIIILPVKAFTYYKSLDNIKGKVLGVSENAINNLISGGQAAANFDFSRADKSFTQASDNFLSAQNQLEEIDGLIFALASIIPDKNIQLAAVSKNILQAGGYSAEAGKNLSLAIASIFDYQDTNTNKILFNLSFYGHKAIINLAGLNDELKQINSDVVPETYQKKFILLKQKTAELNRGLSEFIGLADNLESFLGGSVDKRYLLIFQNNSELRASGGFIGSFALIDFSKGEIKNIEVPGGGSYDTDAGLLKKIKSPEPLRLIRSDWHFWDANWWPDWPTSARKLAWFYENSDGATVDGVIGFTPTVVEKLLKIIGPVDLKEKYGTIIDADNFWLETQKLAEQKPEVTKQPKKIIGDLMNKIIEELPKRLNKGNLVPLLKAIEESLADKNILFYFTDNELQKRVGDLGWDGKIKETTGDYLDVVNTNIAGGKSDRKIKQQIIHKTEIQPDGSIIDDLTIRRVHEAIKSELFSGVRNVDWVRIYVPLGCELIEASGFKPVDKIFFKEADAGWQNDQKVYGPESRAQTDEPSATKIYNEFNKTVFANWSQLDPGQSIEIHIKYRLPFKLTDKKSRSDQALLDQLIAKAGAVLNPSQKNLYSYSLLAQKQPGMNSSEIISELKLSENFQPIWKYPGDLTINQSGWFMADYFGQDKLMAVMVEER